jgi:hypothetical protein
LSIICPFFASDCNFDGACRRIDWRDFEYSHRLVLIAVPVAPSVSAFRLEMTDKIENFNGRFPCSLILENFFHRNGFDVERFATMRRSNGVFEFRNLSRWHSSILLPPTSSHLTGIRYLQDEVLENPRTDPLLRSDGAASI